MLLALFEDVPAAVGRNGADAERHQNVAIQRHLEV